MPSPDASILPLTGASVFGPDSEVERLSGRTVFGATTPPTVVRGAGSKTWPDVMVFGDLRIAIDGWFVHDGRLLLGRSADEQQVVADEVARDLEGFLRRLDNGCFNIVVHDHRARTTRLANDRFGGLPLYILRNDDSVAFASTHAGVRSSADGPPPIDPVGLAELYWFGYQLGKRTSFRGVERLPRATILEVPWDGASQRWREYSPMPPGGDPGCRSENDAADYVFHTMAAVMASLCRADLRYGVKLSAGMDSRLIAVSLPQGGLRAYTFGYPTSREVRLASRLATAIGATHTVVPLRGDFFTPLHAPMFIRQGYVETFHQSLLPAMARDATEFVMDGLAGDVLVGGLNLRRVQSSWQQILGIAPSAKAPSGRDAVARALVGMIKVADDGYRPLTPEASQQVNAHWDEIAHDMTVEVQTAEREASSFEDLCVEVLLNNRSRRKTSSQGTVCRPEVETVYPFLDRRFLDLLGRLDAAWIVNKRLYATLFRRYYRQARDVPSTYSLLSFAAPRPAHLAGRALRYGLERVGSSITAWSGGRWNPWSSDGIQWRRWLAYDEKLQRGAKAFLCRSHVFNEPAYDEALQSLRHGAAFSGSRFMNTASYCGYFTES